MNSLHVVSIQGWVRQVVGPHSPLFGCGPRPSLPLAYILKVIERSSFQVVSATRLAGAEEAAAALKLLGPTSHQPVLVGRTMAQFTTRAS